MKRNKNLSIVSLVLLLSILFIASSSTVSVDARKHHSKKTKPHKHPKDKGDNGGSSFPGPAPAPPADYGPVPTQSSIFDVLFFGAKGDGVSDDSKALLAAWKAACKIPGATVEIPSEFKFLINPITLQGPCMPHLVLQNRKLINASRKFQEQIDGTVLAPSKVGSWPKSSLFQWINFKWLHNFTIQGSGTVDGQGSNWWSSTSAASQSKHIKALRFYSSYDVNVRDIKIIDSPQCHLKFDSSGGVKISNITISSPADSPNTDGIHLQNTQDVQIQHSNIGCGDDCISIQAGCTNVHVHHINCGPGHGISLGGLGKDETIACVSNIVVENISVQNTLSGVRIKTWQGGRGSVKNVTFRNARVSDVKVPIIIDQFYCDKSFCKNQTKAVEISGVKYDQIIGTYSVKPFHLACSNGVPCTDIGLTDIQLNPSPSHQGFQKGLCNNSYGKSRAPLVPSSIDYCLGSGGDAVRRISRSHDYVC
ncbi:hypothetical protein I3760_05G182100 [Carya illinoinensis]|nr:hypothetical protein I3760_05G182100 [Carya illinoinensis]